MAILPLCHIVLAATLGGSEVVDEEPNYIVDDHRYVRLDLDGPAEIGVLSPPRHITLGLDDDVISGPGERRVLEELDEEAGE